MTDSILSDEELRQITRRRQFCAQRRVLDHMGVPYRRRPDGSLLVGRAAFERALADTASPASANDDGMNWSKSA